jgi:SAM-dependent methyltransferase
MAEPTKEVQEHWTRPGVLARIDAVLRELGHDLEHLTPEILAPVEHLHSGGLPTTKDQAEGLALTPETKVLDIGCGIGGPARYLAHAYGCHVTGIDLTPELLETGRVLTKRCGLEHLVTLDLGDALDLSYPDATFDVVWCQNVTMNIADKDGFLAGVHRVLKPGGVFTSTEYSLGPGGEVLYPVMWAYGPETSLLDTEAVMRGQLESAGFRIREWTNYGEILMERAKNAPPSTGRLNNILVFGEDASERFRVGLRNLQEKRLQYWMITAERI